MRRSFGFRALGVAVAVAVFASLLGLSRQAKPAFANGSSVTFVHDRAGRLEAAIDPAVGVATYNYDAAGNLLSIVRTAATSLSLIDFSPWKAPVGASVTIFGTAFSSTKTSNTVKFNGVAATVTSASSTRLVVTVPSASTGTITVKVGTTTVTSPSSFTVTGTAPTISGYSAPAVVAGGSFTITGTGFKADATLDRVVINTTLAHVTAATATLLTVSVPPLLASGRVTVTTPDGSATGSDLIVMPAGIPTSAYAGSTRFTLNGSQSSAISIPVNDSGFFLFDAQAGQRISLNYKATNSAVNRTVFNPDGSVLWSGSSFTDVLVTPTTGTYTAYIGLGTPADSIWVQGWIVPADPTVSVPLDGTSTPQTTTVPGQNIHWTFTGTTGEHIAIVWDVGFLNGLSVVAPDGSTIWSGSDLPDNTTALVLPQAGTYTITDDLYYANLANPESVAVWDVPPDATAALPLDGSHVNLTSTAPTQNLKWTLSATAGQSITVDWEGCGFLDGLSVTAPDGTVVWSGSNLANPFRDYTLTQTGTYTFKSDIFGSWYGPPGEWLSASPLGLQRSAGPQSIAASGSSGSSRKHVQRRTPDGSVDDPVSGTWNPTTARSRGEWSMGTTPRRWVPVDASSTTRETALSGRVLAIDDIPLQNVRLILGSHSAITDDQGRFVLHGVPAGHHALEVDAHAADRGAVHADFGAYEIGVDLAAGKAKQLGFPIYLTRLDIEHAVKIPATTQHETVVTTPEIPGLEVHLPKGTSVVDDDGHAVQSLGITAIPVDRTPFPLPSGVKVPLYFTIQPGLSYVNPNGLSIVYPNYTHLAAGSRVAFWTYDPDGRGWYVYGHGTVTKNGLQIVPDAGVRVWELTGAMIGAPGQSGPAFGPIPGDGHSAGDPVDLGTGLFVDKHTDLELPDTLPISVTREYRQGDLAIRPFGIGMNFSLGMFLEDAGSPFDHADLILGDGGRVHFARTSPGTDYPHAVLRQQGSPSSWMGATMRWNGGGWDITTAGGLTYVFGEEAPIQAIRDRWGNQIRYIWNGSRLAMIQSPHGRWISFSYTDPASEIQSITDNTGRTVSYTYSGEKLQTVTDPGMGVTTYTWDANDRVQSIKSARIVGGQHITYLTNTYDANGRVAQQTLGDGGVYQFVYTNGPAYPGTSPAIYRVATATVTDPVNTVTKATFNSESYETQLDEAVGTSLARTTTLSRQAGTGLITDVTDALSRVTHSAYNDYGQATQVVHDYNVPAKARTVNFTYEPKYQQIATITDQLGHATTFHYDAAGNPTGSTDPLGHDTTSIVQGGNVTSAADAAGNTRTFTYEAGDLVTQQDPLGHSTTYFVDAAGRNAAVTDAAGRTTNYTYDVFNHPKTVTDALGNVVQSNYDADGNLSNTIDARNKTTQYGFDAMNRRTTLTDPLTHVDTTTYDPAGRLKQATDRNGIKTDYTFDRLNRIKTIGYGRTGPNNSPVYTSTVGYAYDAGDNVKTITDSLNGTLTRNYDDFDAVTSETSPAGTVSYTYDSIGRRSTMTPLSQSQITYGYNNANALKTITRDATTETVNYDNVGRVKTLTYPSGIVATYTYDNASNITALSYQQGSTTVGDLSYGYTTTGERLSVAGSLAPTTLPAASSGRTYNDANRLQTVGGASVTWNNDGELLSDGTRTYNWNDRQQLTSVVQSGTTYTNSYDPAGRRTGLTSGATTHSTIFDGATPAAETANPTSSLFPGATGVAATRTVGATTSNLLTDPQGSVVALANNAGTVQTTYQYTPGGVTTSGGTASDNTYQYSGQIADPTGLLYLHARYYSPALGQFASEDPLGLSAGDPNLYRYVGNDPVDHTDTSGLWWGQGTFNNVRKWIGAHETELIIATLVVALVAACVVGGCAFLAGMLATAGPITEELAVEEELAAEAAEAEGAAALDATPGGRVFSAHYLEETGPLRNIPGSVVDEVIDHGQVFERLADRTIYYDPVNDVTVVQSETTGRIMSVRRGMP